MPGNDKEYISALNMKLPGDQVAKTRYMKDDEAQTELSAARGNYTDLDARLDNIESKTVPSYSSSQNGKALTVSNGELAWDDIAGANVSYTKNPNLTDGTTLGTLTSGSSTYNIKHMKNMSSAAASGLYKIAVDTDGHVTSATDVTKSDILALNLYQAGNQLNISTAATIDGTVSTIIGVKDYSTLVTNWNNVKANGWYRCAANTTNAPSTDAWMGYVTASDTDNVIQELWQYTASTNALSVPHKVRVLSNGTWGDWKDVKITDTTYSAGDQLELTNNVFNIPAYCKNLSPAGSTSEERDWNDATENGWYMGVNMQNSPSTSTDNKWYMGRVIAHNANYIIQEVWQFTASTDPLQIPHYMRIRTGASDPTWSEWKNITVGKQVPTDAKFTDTTYSAGDHLSLSSNTFSIAPYCKQITDWNNATTNGWYMLPSSEINHSPSTSDTWWFGRSIAHNNKYCLQEAWAFTHDVGDSPDARLVPHKIRIYRNEVWGDWFDANATLYHVGSDNRKVKSQSSGLTFIAPPTPSGSTPPGWAMGLTYADSSETNNGFIGAFGAGDTINHFDIGPSYSSPWFRISDACSWIYSNSTTPAILRLRDAYDTGAQIQYSYTANSQEINRSIVKVTTDGSTTGIGTWFGFNGGGPTVVSSGESGVNFQNAIFSTDKNPYGTTAWTNDTEKLVNISDDQIYFITGAANFDSTHFVDWTDLKTVILDSNGNFKPSITNKGSIGTSTNKWASMYATDFNGNINGSSAIAQYAKNATWINAIDSGWYYNIDLPASSTSNTLAIGQVIAKSSTQVFQQVWQVDPTNESNPRLFTRISMDLNGSRVWSNNWFEASLTDENVKQQTMVSASNSDLPILFGTGYASTGYSTSYVNRYNHLYYNPYDKTLTSTHLRASTMTIGGTINGIINDSSGTTGAGHIYLKDSAGTYNVDITPTTLTASRTLTLPNKSGTVAVTDDIPTVAGVYLPLAGGSLTGSLAISTSSSFTLNGGDIILKTSGSSSDDSGDLIWYYGNGNEKMRIWAEDTYTAKAGPRYRVFDSSGNSLYSGDLVTADGTGASGTWGINVSGSAASATTASKLSNTSKIGDTNKPVYFTASGVPYEISYTIDKSVPSNAVFTDENVTQTQTTSTESNLYQPILLSNYATTSSTSSLDNQGSSPGTTYFCHNLRVNPHSGNIYIGGKKVAVTDDIPIVTDENLKQEVSSADSNFSIVVSARTNSNTTPVTTTAHTVSNVYVHASDGKVYAPSFHGSIYGAINASGTTYNIGADSKDISGSSNSWDNATANGWYKGSSTTNAPSSDWYFGRTIAHSTTYTLQEAWQFSISNSNIDPLVVPYYVRLQREGHWGQWKQVKYFQGLNTEINSLPTASGTVYADDYFVSQYANGGSTYTDYYRRPVIKLWDLFKGYITVGTTGSGNAVTSVSIANESGTNNRKITFTKGSTFLTDQDVTDKDVTLAWSTRKTIATIGSTDIHVTLPSQPSGGTYYAGTGLSLSSGTFDHSNSVTAVTSYSFCKIKYDSCGHITAKTTVSASDIPDLSSYYSPTGHSHSTSVVNAGSAGSNYYCAVYCSEANGSSYTLYNYKGVRIRPRSGITDLLIGTNKQGNTNGITGSLYIFRGTYTGSIQVLPPSAGPTSDYGVYWPSSGGTLATTSSKSYDSTESMTKGGTKGSSPVLITDDNDKDHIIQNMTIKESAATLKIVFKDEQDKKPLYSIAEIPYLVDSDYDSAATIHMKEYDSKSGTYRVISTMITVSIEHNKEGSLTMTVSPVDETVQLPYIDSVYECD